MRNKKGLAIALSALCVVGSLLAAGCTQEQPPSAEEQEAAEIAAGKYQPEVITKDDGMQIQRTPTENVDQTALDSSYVYFYQDEKTIADLPFNTYYLDADNRGCNACHEDLAETLAAMDWNHVDLRNDYGIQITLPMCLDCHEFGYGYQTNQHSFGTLIHGIHNVGSLRATNFEAKGQDEPTANTGNCWSCHVAQGDGDGMKLWDLEKHNQLRNITPVANVEGDFSYSQDKITPTESIFDFDWVYYDNDYMRRENTANNAPLDEEMFNNWIITVSGAVGKEITYTLPELIAKYGTVDVTSTFHCTLNPTGGPLLANAVYTGVPVDKLLEEAGADPNWAVLSITSSDGFLESVRRDNYDGAILATKVNGESLPWNQGYPVQMIVPGSGAPAQVKEVSDLTVVMAEDAVDIHEWNGWPKDSSDEGGYYTSTAWPENDSAGYQNKPNVGLFDFDEGTIVKAGEPYTFNGYATAYDKTIAALEFSMDGGATWTRYETPGTSHKNWVVWNFTYTPAEDADTAYVLKIRSVTTDGTVTADPIEFMFNAKTEK